MLDLSTKLLVKDAIPDACPRKFNAVLSAFNIVLVLAEIIAKTFPFLTFEPSLTFLLKIVSFPINLKADLQKSKPAIIPFCLAIIL